MNKQAENVDTNLDETKPQTEEKKQNAGPSFIEKVGAGAKKAGSASLTVASFLYDGAITGSGKIVAVNLCIIITVLAMQFLGLTLIETTLAFLGLIVLDFVVRKSINLVAEYKKQKESTAKAATPAAA